MYILIEGKLIIYIIYSSHSIIYMNKQTTNYFLRCSKPAKLLVSEGKQKLKRSFVWGEIYFTPKYTTLLIYSKLYKFFLQYQDLLEVSGDPETMICYVTLCYIISYYIICCCYIYIYIYTHAHIHIYIIYIYIYIYIWG